MGVPDDPQHVSVDPDQPVPGPAERPLDTTRALVHVFERIVGPTALLVALAYHFGRRYTLARTTYFGVDPALLDLSTQDYVQRSLDPLLEPVGTLVLVGLAAIYVHKKLAAVMARHHFTKVLRTLAYILVALGLSAMTVGILSVRIELPSVHYLLLPLAPGIGILLLSYGIHLARRLKSPIESQTPEKHIASHVLVALFAILSLFWATTAYAAALGTGRAQQLATSLDTLPDVVLYSGNSLSIQQPGVVETQIGASDSAYRYRYEGFRYFSEADGSILLIPGEWTRADGSVVVIRNDSNVRFEFRKS